MCVMLFGEAAAPKETEHFLHMLDADHSGTIDMQEFILVEKKAQSVLRPAFALQEAMQEKVKGKKW